MSLARLFLRYVRPSEAFLPVAFFLLVVILSVFAAGPDQQLLGRIGAGTLWTGALLAFLLPVEGMFRNEVQTGALDQLRMAGLACESLSAIRAVALWLSVGAPLLIAVAVGALLLGVPLLPLLGGLAVGMAALSSLGVAAGALVAGARGGEAVAGIVVLPLAVPVMIFGAAGEIRLLAAVSLFLFFAAPFAAGAALRAAT